MTVHDLLYQSTPATLLGAGAFIWHTLLVVGRVAVTRLMLLKGAAPMDTTKLITLLPLVPDAFAIEAEATEAGKTDAQKAAEIIPQLAQDVPKVFATFGASPALVAALGNQALYQSAFNIEQAVKGALPALEALVTKLEAHAAS